MEASTFWIPQTGASLNQVSLEDFAFGHSSCSVDQLCLTLCDPMDCSMPDFPEFAQIHVHWVDDAIQSSHPVFLGFPGGSTSEESTCNVGNLGSIPGVGRSPGEGKGYLLQYSRLQRVRCDWVTFTFYRSLIIRDFECFMVWRNSSSPYRL